MQRTGWLSLLWAMSLIVSPVHAETVEKELANGLKVIVKTDHRAPVVVSQVWYRAGSMDESYGHTGVAHVLEHMMFKGTVEVPAGEFSRQIAAAGGRENAFTSYDYTAYFQTLQKDRLELAFRLEADRMANLRLDAAEFAKEIQVVMEERRMRTEDSPDARLHEALMATAYQSHPYHHPVIGWMGDLKNMTVEDARAWYQRWYAPNNATLVVAGDVVPEQVFALAEKYFAPLPARELPVRKALGETAPSGPREVTVKAPAKLHSALMAWPVPRLADPEQDWEPYALDVLSGVLDGNSSARLPRELVQKQQLAVDVGAGYDPISRGPALFLISASAAEGKSIRATLTSIHALLDRVKRDGIEATELERVKAQVMAARVFQQDSMFYQAMQIAQWALSDLDYRMRDRYFERLKQVTAEQVQEVARKYLTDDRMTLALLDPQPMPKGQAIPARAKMGGQHVR